MHEEVERCECCAGCASGVDDASTEITIVERGISRRVFVARGALAAAAALLAAACAGSDSLGPTLSGSATIDVSSYPSLANVGGVALVDIQGSPFAVVRTGTSTFLALSRICPHQGGLIVQSGSGFRCTVHGATFNSTGTWIGGQRTGSMRSYPTSYDSATSTLTVG